MAGIMNTESLRIAFLAGTLTHGGAEKQLVYAARALKEMGIPLQIYCLTRGEYYESTLRGLGIHPIWVGRFENRLIRLLLITRLAARFRPHIFQAWHFYTNLYVSLLPRISPHAMGVGAIRSNVFHEIEANGFWARWLIRAPDALVANSYTAKQNSRLFGIEKKVYVLPNVIDLHEFDLQASAERLHSSHDSLIAITVARLQPVKRISRFLSALAIARREAPNLIGWIVGDGPERQRLEAEAGQLGLLPHAVRFWGSRSDVPSLLRQADIFVLTSDREGFPNVILEAMAASLPVITTPAGDAGVIVEDGITGYVVQGEPVAQIAECMIRLARDADLRQVLGTAGRVRVEERYSYHLLPQTLERLYATIMADEGKSFPDN